MFCLHKTLKCIRSVKTKRVFVELNNELDDGNLNLTNCSSIFFTMAKAQLSFSDS